MLIATCKNLLHCTCRLPVRSQLLALVLLCLTIPWQSAQALDPQARSQARHAWVEVADRQPRTAPAMQIRGMPSTPHWVADGGSAFRSKSDVINEVKRRYNASVLKITLVESRAIYRVRILLPNGKVRNITVSARR